jgi:ribonucleoside-diphosphate reductase alpha chain
MEPIVQYLQSVIPFAVVQSVHREYEVYLELPIAAPENAITRDDEGINGLYDRIMMINERWIKPGHNQGINRHNVSATINFKPDEHEWLVNKMWDDRDKYSGLSVFPHFGSSYQQAPHEEISKELYLLMAQRFENIEIDLSLVNETVDNTNLKENLACAGGSCELV